MANQKIPPRISVLCASQSPQAIVICRHTSKKTAIIGWDRHRDVFEVTQWLKGKLYPFRSDIAPGGGYWIYFAMSEKNRTYTVLARAPYLKALDFYPKDNAWNGGGLFLSDTCYWLNDGAGEHKVEKQTSGFQVTRQYAFLDAPEPGFSEDPYIYFIRLKKEGWRRQGFTETKNQEGWFTFIKNINRQYDLIKIFHCGLDRPLGKPPYYETYKLYNRKTKVETECAGWEWADMDWDRNRILWAESGKIFAAKPSSPLKEKTELFDTAPLSFRLLRAPY